METSREKDLAGGQFKSHPFVLNVMMLQPSARRRGDSWDRYQRAALSCCARIFGTRDRRADDLTRRTGRACLATDCGEIVFRPQVYSLWGPDDLAIVYASHTFVSIPPAMEQVDVESTDDMRQVIYQCVLPDTGRLLGAPTKPCFNRACLEHIAEADVTDWTAKEPVLKPKSSALRFIAIVRVKLAPYATWEAPASDSQSSDGEVRTRAVDATRLVVREIERWLERDPEKRRAMVGLTVAWNELLVTAYANDVHPLFDFLVDLRQLTMGVGSGKSLRQTHVLLSTRTTIGFDFARERLAMQDVDKKFDRRSGSRPKLLEIIKSSKEFAGKPRRAGAKSSGDEISKIKLTLQFATLPGHERMFADVQTSDGKDGKPRLPLLSAGMADMSISVLRVRPIGSLHRDLPRAKGKFEIDALQAIAISSWIRWSLARHGESRVRSFGATFSTLSAEVSLDRLRDIPSDHVDRDPRCLLIPSACDVESPGDVEAGIGARRQLPPEPSPPTVDENVALPSPVPIPAPFEVRNALRTLQVSHVQTDQILNTLSVVRWLWESLWLWEHCTELLPAVHALVRSLETLAERARRRPMGAAEARSLEPALKALPDQLDAILRTFRQILNAPHWRMAPLADRVDMNLRRRGSLEQWLSITGMVAWSLLDRVMGRRAVLVTIGEGGSPRGYVSLGVAIFEAPMSGIDLPLMIDGMVTEVGRVVFDEVSNGELSQPGVDGIPSEFAWRSMPTRPVENDGAPPGVWRRREDASLDDADGDADATSRGGRGPTDQFIYLRDVWNKLDRCAFGQQIASDKLFNAYVTDVFAQFALGLTARDWATSVALRIALFGASDAIDQRHSKPTHHDSLWLSVVARICAIFAVDTVLDFVRDHPTDERLGLLFDPESRVGSRMYEKCRAEVRKRLLGEREFFRSECLVMPGADRRVVELIADPRSPEHWANWVDYDVMGRMRWLRSPLTLQTAATFFFELRQFVRGKAPGADHGLGSLWDEIVKDLATLRERYFAVTQRVIVSIGDLPELERPSSTSLSPTEDQDPHPGCPGFVLPLEWFHDGPGLLPAHRNAEDLPSTVLCPRGRLLFTTSDLESGVACAINQFHANMLLRIPRYRFAVGQMYAEAAMRDREVRA